jgi:long-subunit acyl-CoA synthetase (AMP-forming)/alkylation response protein AidB-like acyl-CoA dehydrogenase
MTTAPQVSGEVCPTAAAESLVELLARRLAEQADEPAILVPAASRIFPAPSAAVAAGWTWRELIASALAVAESLEAEGLTRGRRLVHLGPQTADWLVVDLACLLAGVVHVAVHAERPAGRCDVGWLGGEAVLVTGPTATTRLPEVDARIIDWRAAAACRLLSTGRLAAAADLEQRLAKRRAATDPDAVATILLSSGTTGRPRGVLHTQRALAANATAAASIFLDEPHDVRLAWLPASHALSRVGDLYSCLVRGGCLAVVEDRQRVLEAAVEAKPAVILGVPAFFDRLQRAVATGRIERLSAALGGRVRVCISGGAPLRPRTAEAFAAAGVPLVQGYGLAEAGPVVSLANPRNARAGLAGPPLPGVRVRCGHDDQLQVAGPSLTVGVIEPDAPQPREVVIDGWLATGDRARIEPDGQLRFLGRLVDAIVLANGEKLAPEVVEAALEADPAIVQVCVLGGGLSRLLAVVVPDPDELRSAMRRMRLPVASRRAAVNHPRTLAWIARRIAARQADLPAAWRVRQIVLLDRPFDPAEGEVTAGFKLRRRRIAERFGHALRAAERSPDRLPAGMAVVPAAPRQTPPAEPPVRSPASRALWAGRDAGFAAAAAAVAAGLPPTTQATAAAAVRSLAAMAEGGTLYDTEGRFSTLAEETLAREGFFGLAVPRDYGGGGAGLLELARVVSLVAAESPTAAGLLSVHSTIGAVSATVAFGSRQQQTRHLPGLARGEPLSIFAATEPDAGCDLGRVQTRLVERDGRLLLSGRKMFITGARHGRLVKLLARREVAGGEEPVVILVRLPHRDTPHFRLEGYPLHPLRHAHNKALVFDDFEVDPGEILQPPQLPGRKADGMAIVWHGLNRGRVMLAAQAAGTLRRMLLAAVEQARSRETWGRPIGSRELVRGRLATIATGMVACEAIAAWAAWVIDSGEPGELEAMVAKITASGLVRDSAIAAFGIHGGRAFLVGHPLGDSLHDCLAVNTYEGESGLLELAVFKGLAKGHPLAVLPKGGSSLSGLRALLAWKLSGWQAAAEDGEILDASLRRHARRARRGLARAAAAIDRAIRRHGRRLAERQLLITELVVPVRHWLAVLAVAHHADRVAAALDDHTRLAAADCYCRLTSAAAERRGGSPSDLEAIASLGGRLVDAPGVCQPR